MYICYSYEIKDHRMKESFDDERVIDFLQKKANLPHETPITLSASLDFKLLAIHENWIPFVASNSSKSVCLLGEMMLATTTLL